MATSRFSSPIRRLSIGLLALLLSAPIMAGTPSEETNKALARQFYEQVWFTRNLDAVDELVAPEYLVHDIGGRKGVVEPADEQKRTAGFLWQNGSMSGHIDYQIAEGDLVATRWQWQYQPRTWWMKILMLGSRNPIPIINVFRFRDGKIVEIWNHRHDIDIGFAANILIAKGFAVGVLSTAFVAFGLGFWRRRRRDGGAGRAGAA